ncbi:MAG: hypothetical protein MJ093_00935 [Saccharofermentans sp.]|nr:hypothetical protein [Saccharofermentans sp.]
MGVFSKVVEESFQNIEVKRLAKTVENLEMINHAMWKMLQRLGCTNEDFDIALADVINSNKNIGKINSRGMLCPSCGKSAQISSDLMRIKCIYCGSEAVINPYELMEMANMQQQAVESVPEQAPVQEQVMGTPDYAQPYDVSQDLNFDDLL